jgi:cytosine deaminase
MPRISGERRLPACSVWQLAKRTLREMAHYRVEEMSGKLPDMAGWQPALPGITHGSHTRFGRRLLLPNSLLPETKIARQDSAMPASPVDAFMEAAIAQARKSRSEGGIPIGSALVRDGKLIAAGHNKRVQESDPVTHAEIDCLRQAGRIGSFKETVLYSTLMPCYLCAGAVVQFGIKKVIVGESRTFAGARELMQSHGVEITDLDLPECVEMMRTFIAEHPQLWNEDIGR